MPRGETGAEGAVCGVDPGTVDAVGAAEGNPAGRDGATSAGGAPGLAGAADPGAGCAASRRVVSVRSAPAATVGGPA